MANNGKIPPRKNPGQGPPPDFYKKSRGPGCPIVLAAPVVGIGLVGAALLRIFRR